MLARGDFPLRYLGTIDLDPTPALCETARQALRNAAARLVLKSGDSRPLDVIRQQVTDAVVAMNWLVGYDCSCDAESRAWEDMTKAYSGSSYDVVELARLRDPKELGRIVREYPARFSMLTPKAHLKAWLGFADEAEYHDRALAGARQLDHRTADAVEMLRNKSDISAPWRALRYLPSLDLEATPALCEAALAEVSGTMAKVYRPRPDDPRPYSELLDRLGRSGPLPALIWLAEHGCNAESSLTDAEAMIRSYQASAESAQMLERLGRLHRKP
jgi:hypothetical protein